MKSRLAEKYQKEVVPALREKFNYGNKLAVPKVLKITVNAGINIRVADNTYQETVENTIIRITGQKPVKTKAKKAISAFKVKEGMVVGMKATLRGQKMYDFLDKLISIALPRIRDFRGLPTKNVDQQGNLSIGIKEHNVFPEIKSDEIEKIHGLEITITTNANNREKGLELLRLMGLPFQK